MSKLTRSLLSWTGILAFVAGMQVFNSRGLASGEPPPLGGITVGGQSVQLDDLRGKPALIYFWASWCSVCKAMQNTVAAVARDYPMIGVALQSGDAGEVARYLKESGFAVDSLLDEDGETGKRYGLRGVPTLFVLDAAGKIRYTTAGYTSEPGLRLRLWLAGL